MKFVQGERAGPARCFFVLGQGRSGTALLARLLSKDRRSFVAHEPWPFDRQILGLSRSGRFSKVVEGMLEDRFETLFRQCRAVSCYGEVNSYLRYCIPWLREHLDARLIHLVRDGRDFVRSAWVRDVLRAEQAQLFIVPEDDDPYASEWRFMSRFERLCWIWRHTNQWLATRIPDRIRLEDVIRDYSAVERLLLTPLGLEVPRSLWERTVRKRINTSRQYRLRRAARGWLVSRRPPTGQPPLGPWEQWDEALRDAFWRICGDLMERFGYSRDG